MSKIAILIIVLALTTSCNTKKIIYIASTLTDCENNSSQKCLQAKENNQDEWTVLNDSIEGFEHKDGFMQKIEVATTKVKNPSTGKSTISYTFVKLIYEEKEASKNKIIPQNYIGEWQVNSMIGMDSLAKQPSLVFKDGSISGNAGCNNYGATYMLNENEITFSLGMVTKMYCTNMAIEKTYFECLSKTKTYKLFGDTITFYDADNSELLRCEKLEE